MASIIFDQNATRLWRPAAAVVDDGERFRRLLGKDWDSLPEATRMRFARRLPAAATIVYSGEVICCRISRVGWCLSQAARLIGAPLPLSRDCGVAANVSVTGAGNGKGQHWTRQYGRHDAVPQVISSTKSFTGPTGIEESIGWGFGIALTLSVGDGTLWFASDHMFWRCRRMRLRLPAWLMPGTLTVGHQDVGGGRFMFSLDLIHTWLGELVHQVAMFADPAGR